MKPLPSWIRLPLALMIIVLLPFLGLAVLGIILVLCAVFVVFYFVMTWRASSIRKSGIFFRDESVVVQQEQVTIIEGEFQQVDSKKASLPEQESRP
jgi:hypothetical protein